MRRILAIVVAAIFVLGLASISFADGLEKCDKCHKGDKAPALMIEKAKIATAADLMKALKEGPKSSMHKLLTDDDINGAAAALQLK
ncbi:MAG TPA: hypothetical protein VK452_08070 [Dissulfurispiraceae bacterium]|nr:hypothetical protein [Dissulfurispiraceae bacterium]